MGFRTWARVLGFVHVVETFELAIDRKFVTSMLKFDSAWHVCCDFLAVLVALLPLLLLLLQLLHCWCT